MDERAHDTERRRLGAMLKDLRIEAGLTQAELDQHLQNLSPATDEERQRDRKLLRKMREEAGMTRQEAAQRLEEPVSYVADYEELRTQIDVIEVLDIVHRLGFGWKTYVTRLDSDEVL